MDIIQVVPRCDLKVYVYDELGNIYLYDAVRLASKYKVLCDKNFFINKCTILNNTLAWDIEGNMNNENCIDVAKESIFTSKTVGEEEVFKYVKLHKEELKERLSL